MIKWDNVLMLPIAGYMQWPWAVLIPGGVLAALFFIRKIPFIAVAAGLDLLLIIPALYLVSLVAVVKFFRSRAGDGAA